MSSSSDAFSAIATLSVHINALPLPPARQSLLDDILALYSCQPTHDRVRRYTPDCVYDDQFVYADDRFKMAGQANAKDYSHTGPGFAFKKWQADRVAGMMDSEDVKAFKADAKDEYHESVRKYASGTAGAPRRDYD